MVRSYPPLEPTLESRPHLAAALAIGGLGAVCSSLPVFRMGVLEVLREIVAFDAGIFHALSPRVPLETGAFVGIEIDEVARSRFRWDDLAVELAPLRELANALGVASDEQAFPVGSRARARFEKHLAPLFRAQSVLVMHLLVRSKYQAAVVLFTRRRRGFGAAAVAKLRELVPILSISDALQARLDGARRSTAQVRLACRDERLTARQRTIAEHVSLGHTNADIARALGLSTNTLRNHLVRMFARVGASNRADLVRLAVLGPFDDP